MRAEKLALNQEYVARLNASPFFIVIDYRGLTVKQFSELRKRLSKAGAEVHVVKNSIFRRSVEAAGVAGFAATTLTGQLAVVTGRKDVAVTAKTVKTFRAEFEKPQIRFGYLGQQRLESADLLLLADLPPLEELRGKLLGLLQAPAGQLVRLLATPAQQLARALQARVDKGEAA
jgi:large subunit ribosomal protein L10